MSALVIDPSRYAEVHKTWQRDPAVYWLRQAKRLEWSVQPSCALKERSRHIFDWFPDGQLNPCFNVLDRHVRDGGGDLPALVWESAAAGLSRSVTYQELQDMTARLAAALSKLGVGFGDRVMIYMPMIPEAIAATIAPTRIGAIHVVVFGGFSAGELARRIDDCQPKVIITASGTVESKGFVNYKAIVDSALMKARTPPHHVIIYQRPELPAVEMRSGDIDFNDCLLEPPAPCVDRKATDPLYILYTSGTTGQPKGVVHDIGGFLTAVHWSCEQIYGMRPGSVFWAASDIGWAAAHTCSLWGPLVVGATSLIFEGKPVGMPDAGAYWRAIEKWRVEAMFAAPTPFRAMRREDPEGILAKACDLSSLKRFYIAGELVDPSTYSWIKGIFCGQLLNHWWQTETAWPITCSLIDSGDEMPFSGSVGKPMPGYDLCVRTEAGDAAPANESGTLAVQLPMPPGFMTGLWGNEERFHSSYLNKFPGYYDTADAGTLGEKGDIYIKGRTDDVINVSGHRLSTGDLEASILKVSGVRECVVIGRDDGVAGQTPVAIVVDAALGEQETTALKGRINEFVREDIGPAARLSDVYFVPRFPVTRSGKVLRSVLRDMVNGRPVLIPPTIEDASVIRELEIILLSRAW